MNRMTNPWCVCVNVGSLIVCTWLAVGCAKQQPPAPGTGPMKDMPGGHSESGEPLKVGSLMAPAHIASVNMEAKDLISPMGMICTCRFNQDKQAMVFGTISDPEVAAVAKHLQSLIPKLDKKEFMPVVILHGGSGDKEQDAAKNWAKKNGLTKILVTVSDKDDAKRMYHLTDKCTIFIVDDIHKLRARLDGFDDNIQKQLDKALKP